MKLKKFVKIMNKLHKKCGNTDIEFNDKNGNPLYLESVGHFSFVKDVTMTFTDEEVTKGDTND